jgi:hypothetical protein
MLHRFFWLTSGALQGLYYAWPVTLILSLLIVAAAVYTFVFKRTGFRQRYVVVLSPLLLSLLVLVWGTLMAHGGATRGPAWVSNVVGILFLLHIPLAIGVFYFVRGVRLFGATVMLLELWFGWLCMFIAAMSVSNVWL